MAPGQAVRPSPPHVTRPFCEHLESKSDGPTAPDATSKNPSSAPTDFLNILLLPAQAIFNFGFLCALVLFTRRFDLMGEFANARLTDFVAWIATVLVVSLNLILLLQATGVSIPFLLGGLNT
jgi:hypothetical protein